MLGSCSDRSTTSPAVSDYVMHNNHEVQYLHVLITRKRISPSLAPSRAVEPPQTAPNSFERSYCPLGVLNLPITIYSLCYYHLVFRPVIASIIIGCKGIVVDLYQSEI